MWSWFKKTPASAYTHTHTHLHTQATHAKPHFSFNPVPLRIISNLGKTLPAVIEPIEYIRSLLLMMLFCVLIYFLRVVRISTAAEDSNGTEANRRAKSIWGLQDRPATADPCEATINHKIWAGLDIFSRASSRGKVATGWQPLVWGFTEFQTGLCGRNLQSHSSPQSPVFSCPVASSEFISHPAAFARARSAPNNHVLFLREPPKSHTGPSSWRNSGHFKALEEPNPDWAEELGAAPLAPAGLGVPAQLRAIKAWWFGISKMVHGEGWMEGPSPAGDIVCHGYCDHSQCWQQIIKINFQISAQKAQEAGMKYTSASRGLEWFQWGRIWSLRWWLE